MEKKILTLCCVYDDARILLGEIKKEGKLKGMFNGFGGKVEQGETIEQAAARELEEEAGIFPLNMKKRGVLTFIMDPNGNPFEHNLQMEVHVYSVTDFKGKPFETLEMRPKWFLHSEIPYANMWPDDIFWLPLMLEGKNFEGTFRLKDPKNISSYDLKVI
jgi:8-oxo-dGTP pyrophosphatase MutT (NUDIX family)